MDILITHLMVTAAIGFVVLLGLVCVAASVWGAYALTQAAVAGKISPRRGRVYLQD